MQLSSTTHYDHQSHDFGSPRSVSCTHRLVALFGFCALISSCAIPDPYPPVSTEPTVDRSVPVIQPEASPTAKPTKIISLVEIAKLLNVGDAASDSVRRGWQALEVQLKQKLPLESLRIHIALEAMLNDAAVRSEGHQRIWDLLQKLPEKNLDFADAQPPDPFRGWVELARIKRNSELADDDHSLESWWQRYPDHPAKGTVVTLPSEQPPQVPVEQSVQLATWHDVPPDGSKFFTPGASVNSGAFVNLGSHPRPQKIGLLLPLNGRHEKSARIILDGFLATWFADTAEDKPHQIHIYDTTTGVTAAYQQALSDDVHMIIGPLLKNDIAALLCNTPLTIPVLTLNRLSAQTFETEEFSKCPLKTVFPIAIFQFALAPEDEALLVAQRMFYDGYKKSLVVAPKGRWGQRVVEVFTDEFERLGGLVADHVYYRISDAAAMKSLVAAGLHIEASKKRLRDMQRVLDLTTLHHRPYQRQDIDAVFMLSKSQTARQLRPLFEFHRAHELPIYATSHVYEGNIGSTKNNDLNGVQFCDIPWVLEATKDARRLQKDLALAWSHESHK